MVYKRNGVSLANSILNGAGLILYLSINMVAAQESTETHAGDIPLSSNIAVNGHSIAARTQGLERAVRRSEGMIVTKFYEMTGPYASLQWRWNNRDSLLAGGQTTPQALAEGDYGAFITTEANAGAGPYPGGGITDPNQFAVAFFDLYYASNPSGQGYILTFWNNRLDHPDVTIPGWEFDTPEQWRERIEEDQLSWEAILEFVNANKSKVGSDVKLIPYLELYKQIYDNLSTAPRGANRIFDWFDDNVHPSDRGRWAGGALISYQLFGIDPARAPLRMTVKSHNNSTLSVSVTSFEREFLAPLIRKVVNRNR